MALELDKPTRYGKNTVYHKVTHTEINWLDNTALVRVGSFVDKQARDEGARPIELQNYSFQEDEEGRGFPFTKSGNNVAQAYESIKVRDEWKEAKDV